MPRAAAASIFTAALLLAATAATDGRAKDPVVEAAEALAAAIRA
jgi:hypothetical protein